MSLYDLMISLAVRVLQSAGMLTVATGVITLCVMGPNPSDCCMQVVRLVHWLPLALL